MTFLAKPKTTKNQKGQYITFYICLKKKTNIYEIIPVEICNTY